MMMIVCFNITFDKFIYPQYDVLRLYSEFVRRMKTTEVVITTMSSDASAISLSVYVIIIVITALLTVVIVVVFVVFVVRRKTGDRLSLACCMRWSGMAFLLLICDTIHNRMTSRESNKNPYCTLVSHGCIHAPLVRPQAKPKVVRSYRQHENVTECGKPLNPTLDLQVALFASSKNTRCAASDVNPFKIRCNLQITKATVNETQ